MKKFNEFVEWLATTDYYVRFHTITVCLAVGWGIGKLFNPDNDFWFAFVGVLLGIQTSYIYKFLKNENS